MENIPTCAQYAKDLFSYLRTREHAILYNERGREEQMDVSSVDREKVIEWISEMQTRFKLRDETLYLAVNIFDRYLQTGQIKDNQYFLIGIASILIASKYEEIYPPHLKQLLLHIDTTAKEVHAMELKVLKALNFDISVPTVLVFLERHKKFFSCDENRFNLALYVCEGQLLSGIMSKYKPSLLAVTGLYIAERAMNKDYELNEALLNQLDHSKDDIINCAQEMLNNMLVKERILLSNIRKKYVKFKDIVKIALDSISVY